MFAHKTLLAITAVLVLRTLGSPLEGATVSIAATTADNCGSSLGSCYKNGEDKAVLVFTS